jgi:hypothetical protein
MLQICTSYKQRHVDQNQCLLVLGRAVLTSFVKRWMDLFLGSRAATAAALLLALIARDEIGMPLQVIREEALIGASV